jgi:DNA-binding beta-propeller fold protein YncE
MPSRYSFVAIVAMVGAMLVSPSPAIGQERIYWVNNPANTISFANLDGSGGGGQLSAAGATVSGPFGLAIDPAAGKIYWTNNGNSTISFANLDGSGGGQLSTVGAPVSAPAGLAIDPVAGRIYWANLGDNTIAFARLDGTGGGPLSTIGAVVTSARGMAVDRAAGRLYWVNGNNTIGFANLDGTGGGGQLSTAGATMSVPAGPAIDPVAGRIYWTNNGNNTISFAKLDGTGGGGQLPTTGATPAGPFGAAVDPVTGRIYWANNAGATISFANLDGSGGGGQLSTSGASQSGSDFPALLKVPAGAGVPAISGGGRVGEQLTCSQGSWAADLLGSFLFRAPRSFAYQWQLDGLDILTATQTTHTPSSPGDYSCRVTATNHAGSTSQTAAALTVVLHTPTLSTLASSGIALGGSVSDTAMISGGLSPTGTMTFRLYGPNDATCAGAPVFVDTKPVAGNGSYLSSSFTPTAAGAYRWIASYGGDANNVAVSGACNDVNESVTIAKANQAITFPAIPAHAFGDPPFGISAASSSLLTVTFTSTTPSVCTVSLTTVTIIAAGTCTIAADQAGDGNYNPAPQVSQSVGVTKANQAITFGALGNRNFGTAPFAVSATASSTLGVTFTSLTPSVCTVSVNTVTMIAVGSCTIAADQAGNASYNAAPQVTQSFSVLAVVSTTFTGPTATGSGIATASFTGGGAGCTFAPSGTGPTQSSFFIPVSGHPKSPPPLGSSITFPHGLLDFVLAGCTPGSSVAFTVTYPAPLPAGTQYWKYGPTPGNTAPHWYVLSATIAGNVATFTIADGGLGDDDLVANGTIVDQGGPGVGPTGGGPVQTPTLSEWATILLALMLFCFGSRRLRRDADRRATR